MRRVNLTDGRRGRDLCSGGERWRPLAHHLAASFAATGGGDERMVQAAIAVILDAESRLGSRRPDFSALVVPLVIRALRRYRHERIRSRPESVHSPKATCTTIDGSTQAAVGSRGGSTNAGVTLFMARSCV